MRRHCISIKEVYGQQYTAELLRQSDNEGSLRNFFRIQNIIVIQCEQYHDQPQSFGNTYADILTDKQTRSLVGSRNTIKEACDFLHFLGLHVVGINSYVQNIANEQAVAIIKKSQSDTQKLFMSLEQKSSQTKENIAHTFEDNEQIVIQHVIQKTLMYIREAIQIQKKEGNTQTKDLVEKLASLEDELIRNKLSTNYEKNKNIIQQSLNIIDQLEQIHMQNIPNNPIFAGSIIGNRDIELAYSTYTRRDIRHPERQPYLSMYDKIAIYSKFIYQDIIAKIYTIDAGQMMQTINQCIYIAILIYILYGLGLMVINTTQIQSRTYNLINIGVFGITRYATYKLYQKHIKNIYVAIGIVIIVRQIITRWIYSYLAL